METERLRLAVYRSFAATGRAPHPQELTESTGLDPADVEAGLRSLHEQRLIVLDTCDYRVLMAHPFTSIPLGFSVMGERTLWWGGCAWDSFALPHLLPDQPRMLVATVCPGCGTALAWNVSRRSAPRGDEVAHFLVPAAHMWDDVIHTCANQRLFCGERCVDAWLARTKNRRGYVMPLKTLWRLASRWYEGRLDPGYVRREPQEAAAYFKRAGLSGRFWGLRR